VASLLQNRAAASLWNFRAFSGCKTSICSAGILVSIPRMPASQERAQRRRSFLDLAIFAVQQRVIQVSAGPKVMPTSRDAVEDWQQLHGNLACF
jgi:hypothetical protein